MDGGGGDDHGEGERLFVEPPPAGSVRLEFRVPAEPAGVGSARKQVRGWLSALEWPSDELDDLLLVTNEACTNAVEHAYLPGAVGDVMVTLWVAAGGSASRQVIVLVRDWGHWRPVPVDPGFRGHGLAVMRGLTEHLGIRRDHDGTSVTMVSCPVPVLPPMDEDRRLDRSR